MRLAYLIMLHDRPAQAMRLLRAIYRPEHRYLVHVDRRAGRRVTGPVDEAIAARPNVRRMRSRMCTYQGWGAVATQLAGIRDALEHDWRYFINLSAQDYPLRSQEEIASELAACGGCSLLDVVDQARDWPDSLDRLRPHIDFLGRLIRLPGPRRSPPGRPHAGGQWFILARDACEYLVSSHTQSLRRFYRFTAVPDESFIQTALVNSPLRASIVNGNRRFVEFDGDRPRVLTLGDVRRLQRSEALFARKFDLTLEVSALDYLDAEIGLHDGGR